MFLIMVLRAMLDDPNINRVKSFVKRLAQSCFYSSSGYTCAVLLILRDVMRGKPALRTFFSDPEHLLGEKVAYIYIYIYINQGRFNF